MEPLTAERRIHEIRCGGAFESADHELICVRCFAYFPSSGLESIYRAGGSNGETPAPQDLGSS